MRELTDTEITLLHNGNAYQFAHLVLELYPEICAEAGFIPGKCYFWNMYARYMDGCFVLISHTRAKGIEKYLFSNNMEFIGTYGLHAN